MAMLTPAVSLLLVKIRCFLLSPLPPSAVRDRTIDFVAGTMAGTSIPFFVSALPNNAHDQGVAGLVVGHPFDTGQFLCIIHVTIHPLIRLLTVKVRFQSPRMAKKYKSTFHALVTIIREERFFGLYKGIITPLVGQIYNSSRNADLFRHNQFDLFRLVSGNLRTHERSGICFLPLFCESAGERRTDNHTSRSSWDRKRHRIFVCGDFSRRQGIVNATSQSGHHPNRTDQDSPTVAAY
jgi:hypothetical protein